MADFSSMLASTAKRPTGTWSGDPSTGAAYYFDASGRNVGAWNEGRFVGLPGGDLTDAKASFASAFPGFSLGPSGADQNVAANAAKGDILPGTPEYAALGKSNTNEWYDPILQGAAMSLLLGGPVGLGLEAAGIPSMIGPLSTTSAVSAALTGGNPLLAGVTGGVANELGIGAGSLPAGAPDPYSTMLASAAGDTVTDVTAGTVGTLDLTGPTNTSISADVNAPGSPGDLSGQIGTSFMSDPALMRGLMAGDPLDLSNLSLTGPTNTTIDADVNAPGLPSDAPKSSGGAGGAGDTKDSKTPGMFSGFKTFLNENAGLIGLGALGASALTRPKGIPELSNLQSLASTGAPTPAAIAAGNSASLAAGTAASALIPSVQTGTLPPGAEQNVENALNDAIQSIRSKYAQLGLAGSTMEAQEIAQAHSRAEGMKFDLANQLTKTGLEAAGISLADLASRTGSSANIYGLLMQAQLQQDSALSNTLARFASAAAFGSGAAAKGPV